MEEAKKMKRQIYKQFVQVFVAHCEFLSYLPKHFTLTFVELCMEMPFWCTVLVHQYGRRKSSKTFWSSLFLYELFHSRVSIRAQVRLFFLTRQHSYFGVKLGSSSYCIFKMKHATALETSAKTNFC